MCRRGAHDQRLAKANVSAVKGALLPGLASQLGTAGAALCVLASILMAADAQGTNAGVDREVTLQEDELVSMSMVMMLTLLLACLCGALLGAALTGVLWWLCHGEGGPG